MRCTNFFYQTEVVKNQNLQLLCYVIFFDILHHYGVIVASQICSVSRKYCAVLRNRFFFMNGNKERAKCAPSRVCIPWKKENNFIKYLKRVNKKHLRSVIKKKKSCHLAPKVVIDLPFEGRKVERSWKYRGRERVPKVGSKREETITEPINSRIGEFHTIVVGKCCLTCGTWPSHWRWNTGGQFIRTVTKVIAVETR